MAGDDAVDEDKVTLCCAVCCANCGIYPTEDCCGCSGKAVSFRNICVILENFEITGFDR